MRIHSLGVMLLTFPLLGGVMACEPNSDAEKAKNKPKVQQSAAKAGSEPVSEMSPVKADNSQGDRIVPNHSLPIEQQLGQPEADETADLPCQSESPNKKGDPQKVDNSTKPALGCEPERKE
ncbi:hypothetical protein L1D29_18145 [Shewanella insulae]|uniref:hypothetical protein n=1 Tax=Shewanella insulae TaxID=2681496 RepID=UPI001EFDED37|nr:hypothetical protein [Shewanella insulae]MCG9714726.1 hypothetical protein [Shewanella insulae]